jgi:hypothetical protein
MSTNATIFVAAATSFATHSASALIPAAAMALSLVLTAWLGWRSIASTARAVPDRPQTYPMSEGWSTVSFIAAGMIMSSLERLIAPSLLDLSALAVLSILATLAGSPFQTLSQTIGYTLVPGLRNAPSHAARMRVIRNESFAVILVCLFAMFAIWLVTPFVLRMVLTSRYEISRALLIAAILLGVVKVFGSLAAAAINALGSGTELARLSLVGWLSIAVAGAAGWAGSSYGVTGLMYGVAIGWLARAVLLGGMAWHTILSSNAPAAASHGAQRLGSGS